MKSSTRRLRYSFQLTRSVASAGARLEASRLSSAALLRCPHAPALRRCCLRSPSRRPSCVRLPPLARAPCGLLHGAAAGRPCPLPHLSADRGAAAGASRGFSCLAPAVPRLALCLQAVALRPFLPPRPILILPLPLVRPALVFRRGFPHCRALMCPWIVSRSRLCHFAMLRLCHMGRISRNALILKVVPILQP